MNVPLQHYLLFDGVLHEQLLPWLYQRNEDLEIEPLYTGTAWAELAEIGPVLVKPFSASGLLADIEHESSLQTCASILHGRASMPKVARHLRQFIQVRDSLGSNSLLRFADPLVAQYWLGSYGTEELSSLLGPIDQWRLRAHCPRWQAREQTPWLTFDSREHTGMALSLCPILLGEPQIQALDQAYQQRFLDRLDAWCEQAHTSSRVAHGAHWSSWLHRQLQAAVAWGLTSERSIAAWLDLHIHLGDDAFMSSDGPYAGWIANNPQARTMSSDARIQAFEADNLTDQQKGFS
tara:strand:+ start:382 stop:1257 length:876 start_codon:yes stop_codon:yes gene_type:complete